MKPEWKQFLKDAGAEIDDNASVESFGNSDHEQRVIHSGLVICDLSHQGLISAYGDDAGAFLQGQLTNDVREVDEQHSQLSAYCTPKGRMLANFRIFKRDDTYYLRLPRTLLENTLKRLSMFVLMSKVTLTDASDSLVHFGFSGPNADGALKKAVGDCPQDTDQVLQISDYTVIRVAGPHPRFEIFGELEAMKTLWNKLDVDAAPVGAGPWEMLDILAGTPTIYPQTSEAFVPQMVNMQLLNGVNFKKGCYTGQEVVARMQYLGKLKRRMFMVKVITSDPVMPGDALYAAGSRSGQGTGNIVAAQPDPDGGHLALAVIDISDAEANALQLRDQDGPHIQLKDLPYQVPVAKE